MSSQLSELRGLRGATMHLMPCEIQHDGRAAVSSYFDPLITPDSSIALAQG